MRGGDGGLTTVEREELNRLRRENRQLRVEFPPAKSRRPVPALSAYLSNPSVSCVLAIRVGRPFRAEKYVSVLHAANVGSNAGG